MAAILPTLALIGGKIAGATAAAGGFAQAASIAGTALSAGGTIYSGIRQNQASKYEAKALKAAGDAKLAEAQRKAIETRKEKDILLSRQQAVAAASGGGTDNETVTSLMAKTEQRGEYSALMDMYSGTVMRDDLYRDAAVTRQAGKDALVGSVIEAGAKVGTGLGNIYTEGRAKRRAARESTYLP